ncbi:N-acetylglucosamine-6-phosphate deacetylase [Gymnodinialimonas sp.]
MSEILKAFVGAEIFDGVTRRSQHALMLQGADIVEVMPKADIPPDAEVIKLKGGLICPGFVDLQVNGGGGVMFNDDQSVAALRTIARAHARLGATSILPTLITDTPERTRRSIDAVEAAVTQGVAGIIGLHLEGPHLSATRKGAHAAALIRPMEAADLALLLEAAARLPMLKVTVAPENVTTGQISDLHEAGVLVSLGHSDASFADCEVAAKAGARCVTHLFNAMSQLGSRAPGLVGSALTNGALHAGLIADGVHVHPASVRAALAAKQGPGHLFLVSDAMAVAGTDLGEFHLNGRRIARKDGRLTLEDGTLAGADLDLRTAVRNLVKWGAATEDEALAMATSIPGSLCGHAGAFGHLTPGARADFLHFPAGKDGTMAIWQAGQPVA